MVMEKKTRRRSPRGVALNEWGQVKTRTTITLRPEAVQLLDALAAEFGCGSKSELMERIARRELKIRAGEVE